MNNSTDHFSKSVDENHVYADLDGLFQYRLVKCAHDNETIDIMIVHNSIGYHLFIRSNNQTRVDTSDTDIESVKNQFNKILHELTGNYWKYHDSFVKVPGNYHLSLNDVDFSSRSEEQEIRLNRIKQIPRFISNERAFFNCRSNSIQKTYTYTTDGSNSYVILPEDLNANLTASLLFVRKMVVRIGILYKHGTASNMYFATGLLLTNTLVLTCAHNFDPILWGKEKVAFSKIYVCSLDPASGVYFVSNHSNNYLIGATIIRRGLIEDDMNEYNEVKCNTTDLAVLRLDEPTLHLQLNEYFHPKLHSSSTSNSIPINSELFLVAYNGELTEDDDLKPYRHLREFRDLTIDTLNYAHHANHKSISIGRLIKEPSPDNSYALHDCSTLPGSSGALILDSTGQFAGIHVGVYNSRIEKQNDVFFTKDTFNKFIPVHSKEFCTFIRETILSNLPNGELSQKWLFHSE